MSLTELSLCITFQSTQLGNNQIKCTGAEAIADALKVNKSLKVLDLDENNIDTRGGTALAVSLLENETLTKLSLCTACVLILGKNCIDSRCVPYLISAIQKNQVLEVLNLSYFFFYGNIINIQKGTGSTRKEWKP
eukprot:TRINITY_DN1586_c0_g1_i1.p4 TRINITY_DN1586_c0_g1~~TRINITY_DN1586_c0_g1_i1.p4  ORF type:complete len:135 (-),score=5.49 TRINITY_DN1586_c0_g1_i1:260-664(-)